jgi:hypothetical protein
MCSRLRRQRNQEQLQQLVAPIALYPDALIAQSSRLLLSEQIVEAIQWVDKHKGVRATN